MSWHAVCAYLHFLAYYLYILRDLYFEIAPW